MSVPIQLFTRDEIAQILAAARRYGPPERQTALVALLTLLANLGLRITEALRLTWADVDLERGEITVSTLKQRVPTRDALPMNATIREALRGLRNGATADQRLFPFPSRGVVYNILQILLHRAGIPRRRLHAFRHACATRLLEETGDLIFVRDVLRHRSIGTTSRYLHSRNLREKFQQLAGVG